MDKLEHIFAQQEKFDRELAARRGLEFDLSTWVQKEVLAIMVELAELLDEINYKWWKTPHPVDQDAVKEELADVLHFFISLCLKAGLTADELYEAYLAKNAENFRRQAGLSSKQGYGS